jgi:EpsD family peptidyl-prolyl cis-trans isomerase
MALLLLAGCGGPAKTPVAATVNGYPISVAQLDLELSNAGVPNAKDPAVRRAALQRIIVRRLLAAEAQKSHLEATAQAQALKAALLDSWRANLAEAATVSAAKPPTDQEVDAFIGAHPELFSGRMVYLVDRLTVVGPASADLLNALKPTATLEAAEAVLKSHGVEYQRSVAQLDSASMSPAIGSQIAKLPPNEPFILPSKTGIDIARVRASKAQPISGVDAQRVARILMITQQRAKLMSDKLAALRKDAKITYGEGYQPGR